MKQRHWSFTFLKFLHKPTAKITDHFTSKKSLTPNKQLSGMKQIKRIVYNT